MNGQEKEQYEKLIQGLSAQQIEAVNTIDDDVEIIACAGAGKTSVVTRRIINILRSKPDVKPENIVAFTFTRKAAEELKNRIYSVGKSVLGNTQGFANMYIGTIHGFCLQMLQEYLPEFQTFSVLDEIHARLFVERYYSESGMLDLDLKIYTETRLYLQIMSLLNENWYDEAKWSEPVREAFHKYRKKLYAEHYFDYSLIIREMVERLESDLAFRSIVADRVRYLTVDEYQDTNPAQERLVSILKEMNANLCVVGDDDQTIYQFRGSDENNILTFLQRYQNSKYLVLDTNYRCTEGVVDLAGNVIRNNSRRLPKQMKSGCSTPYDEGDIVYLEPEDTEEEYQTIARHIRKLNETGAPYSDMAILVRMRKIGPAIAEALKGYEIPFIIEGMNELMYTQECQAAKGIFDYLHGDIDSMTLFMLWKCVDYHFEEKELADAIGTLMTIDVAGMKYYPDLNLQSIYHNFLKQISLVEDGREETELILYNLGKFSQVIADYEVINFTRNPVPKLSGFCSFLKYSLNEYPEGVTANSYIKPDAVTIMTVHQAKGLEYAAVFVPGLNTNFFPAQGVGGKSIWSVIDRSWITGSSRFDGDLEDERKLFYVAVTRAKKFLLLSRATQTRNKKESTFLKEAKNSEFLLPYDENVTYQADHLPALRSSEVPLVLNFSLLEDYFICPYRFKLSVFYGFVQPMSERMGYGDTMHAIVRNINLASMNGQELSDKEVQKIIDQVFFLPYATPKQRAAMFESVKRGIFNYVHKPDNLQSILLAEAPIEIDLGDNVSVNGRIDMVKAEDKDGKIETVIVDFKTANRRVEEAINTEQLKIYALGYEHLTGDQADYMEIYHLDSERSARRPVTPGLTAGVEADIRKAASHIRQNDLPRVCSKENCSKCRLWHLCLDKQERKMIRDSKNYG